jgi:hypothetical protein
MSNIHVREFDVALKTVRCVFHIPVPAAGTNVAGTQWQVAVKNWKEADGTITSAIPEITPAELTQLQNGELLEIGTSVRFSSTDLTNAERSAEISAAYAAKVTEVQTDLQVELNFFGYEI